MGRKRKSLSTHVPGDGDYHHSDASFTDSFEEYRSRLQQEYGDKDASEREALYPMLDKDTVLRLLNPSYKSNFSKQTKNRLAWFYDGRRERSAYTTIANMLTPDGEQSLHLPQRWCRSYRYFRYFAPTGNTKDFEYTFGGGRLQIEDIDGVASFKHWSHNHEVKEPEHEGFVFFSQSNVYMLGMNSNAMRLGIAFQVDNPADEAIIGVIVSRRKYPQYTPFGARFIMVDQNNKELFEFFSDRTRTFRKLSDGTKYQTTVGENNFHEKVGGGDYSYFMLASQ